MKYTKAALITLCVSFGFVLLAETNVVAATLTVTKILDTADGMCDADCSLREAIATAAFGDTILFSSLFDTPQTITLTGGQLVIDKNLTIIGTGADKLTVSGNNQSRIFHIHALGALSLSGMSITGGNDSSGGGILSEGSLTVDSCHVGSNTAGSGGGIASLEGSTTIRNSTISANSAVNRGGGIWFDTFFGGILTVTNSTISGNTVSDTWGEGGGIWAISNSSLGVQIRNSTITNNSPGGIFAAASFPGVELSSSIIAANQNNSVVPDVDGGPFRTFSDYNFIGNTTGDFRAETNIAGNPVVQVDPKLGALAYNGGPTPTHALLPCSLAIDHGANFADSAYDQRGIGFSRDRDGDGDGFAVTDIGAFEAQTFAPAICNTGPPTLVPANPTIQQGTSAWLDIANVSDPDGLFGVGLIIISANPSNGVRISDLSMFTAGVFSANVGASCSASNANFDLLGGDRDFDVSGTLMVTVTSETTPPVMVLRTDPITLSPNDHKYQNLFMNAFVISAKDNCDSSVNSNSVIVEQVTSDEPENAPGKSDGNTDDDIVIAPDCKSVQLRAERDGDRDGRVYSITLRVRDALGNTTRVTGKVTVPVNQNGDPAIESAPQYMVTSSCP